jgi:2-oxoglutarate ferredoxin oxidoreductase subunit delta
VPKIVIDTSRCKGCALCTTACPRELLHMSSTLNRQGYFAAEIVPEDLARCTSCTLCAQMCPDLAIGVFREKKTGNGG